MAPTAEELVRQLEQCELPASVLKRGRKHNLNILRCVDT
jgi:hypothetical protein